MLFLASGQLQAACRTGKPHAANSSTRPCAKAPGNMPTHEKQTGESWCEQKNGSDVPGAAQCCAGASAAQGANCCELGFR